MSAKNNLHAIGNIGRDVEVRRTPQDMAVATFPLPIESGYGDKKVTSWVRCTLFGKRAEGGLIPYLVKGQKVAVTGSIKLNVYTSKDGVEKTSLDMNVDDIALVGKRPEQAQPEQQQRAQQSDDPFAPTGSSGRNKLPDGSPEDDIEF